MSNPTATIVFLHGGGLILGNQDTGIGEAIDWVEKLAVVVVSIDYRLAPGARYAEIVDDCLEGLVWTAQHARDWGAQRKPLVLAGMSAGGGLAVATAIRALEVGAPPVAGQLLLSPMLDDRTDATVQPHGGELPIWDGISNETGWSAALGARRRVKREVTPARATDLEGLPSTYLEVGSVDLFLREDLLFAQRLIDSGVSVECHVWPGAMHGFSTIAPDARLSRRAREARRTWLEHLVSR
ncbi:MAG: alpha/beta hydrolase [Microcella sp.]|uniref:alpha/beta hydrolase n=1 Tax=Microcella sp. TaxID=1913979 RepID=UPI003314736E